MALLTEPDVIQFRHDYYELLARLLSGEPDEALLSTLRDGIEERSSGATQVHPLIGEGWRRMAERLGAVSTAELVDEFTRLFLGPYTNMVNPYESYYVVGRAYEAPLAEVRGFIAQNGLEAAGSNRGEPEDALAFELGVMAGLIQRQRAGGDADPQTFVEAQRRFLAEHLLVWAPTCIADIERNDAADFYLGVAQILRGFLEVERDFFVEEGGLAVESLAAARRRHHATVFRGPIVDPIALGARATPNDDEG